ncbi:amidohydrolase [Pseudohalioglobus sediminis]|uniref:Amidohydrolase n=1 Tax=Pseudohalioglobus sediminis TaxID=2606449 RepID=A0A5B0X5M2_9GAMM|nr:amidohydrolase [Pseudohalioglobus sediminis]KAA1194640.1 amidohydrolase [Pseudohalioglobus sediminis]
MILLLCLALFVGTVSADPSPQIAERALAIEQQVIDWRHDFHRHPELGNREFRTAGIVAEHLKTLGYEVRTGVAHTGVVGVLRGGKSGPVIALRADMDALPVTEKTGLPYASTATAQWAGETVGVMHACGHDAHVAMLMGAATLFAELRDELPGTVVLIFQPAEEGVPPGETGGAYQMVQEGVLENPAPEAIIGLHVAPDPSGHITYTPGAALASSDPLTITVRGEGVHGASPWLGVDPIVAAAQIVMGLQTVVSRQTDLVTSPAVITIGSIHGGNRGNVIPDEVVMRGTIRTLDPEVRTQIHQHIRRTVSAIASSAGAEAEVHIDTEEGYPVTVNDDALTAEMVAVLKQRFGEDRVYTYPPVTGAEDFSFFAERIPGFYFYLGIAPPGLDKVPANHSPRFVIDDAAMRTGVAALVELAYAYLEKRSR